MASTGEGSRDSHRLRSARRAGLKSGSDPISLVAAEIHLNWPAGISERRLTKDIQVSCRDRHRRKNVKKSGVEVEIGPNPAVWCQRLCTARSIIRRWERQWQLSLRRPRATKPSSLGSWPFRIAASVRGKAGEPAFLDLIMSFFFFFFFFFFRCKSERGPKPLDRLERRQISTAPSSSTCVCRSMSSMPSIARPTSTVDVSIRSSTVSGA